MGDTKFDFDQERAINSTGNVIVSAGAGSGKTTVLTERVKRNILGQTANGEVKLDELLILTFTNDAATSMKNKIKKALAEDSELSYLVPFVDSAHIETFDAYSQFIVKKYGHYIGVSKNINVLDNDILFVKISNLISDKLNEQYLKKDPIFEEIIFNCCSKNDNNLLNFLLQIYNDILVRKDNPIEFLKNYEENILNKKFFEDILTQCETIYKKTKDEMRELIEELNTVEICDLFNEAIAVFFGAETLDGLLNLKDSVISYSKLHDKLNKILKDSASDFYAQYDKDIAFRLDRNYRRIYRISRIDKETFLETDIELQIKHLTFLIDNVLMPALYEAEKFKRSTNYFTFGDIANMAIRILKENESVRLELKNKYKLIMVDETQDNSFSQEEFISLISNNNVFSVGDIKQSIYRFRNARPELFKTKYDKYSAQEGGVALNMNNNYRSRKEILNVVNDMFSNLMSDDFGGANYKKDHIINPKNQAYETYGKSNVKHGVFQIPYSETYFNESGELETNKESRIRGEAQTICDNILARINGGFEVYDQALKTNRKCEFKDFTVLTYKGVNFQIFEEVFKENGIPLNAIYSEDLKTDNSIVVLINIFSLLCLLNKNEKSDEDESNIRHNFASILRSFIFRYKDEELYKIFKDKDQSYKNNEIFILFENLTKNYANSSLNLLFDKVIESLNYVSAFSTIKEVINAIDKNNIFYNKTKTMDELGYTLDDFVLYLNSLGKFNIKMEQTIYSEASNAVTLTTIHKSKGLEYPVVYLPNLFDFVIPDFKNNGDFYVVNGEFFFMPFFSDPHKETNLIALILESDKDVLKADKEERLRLLYVALTRAKEDLIFIVSKDKVKSYEEVKEDFTNKVKARLDKRGVKYSTDQLHELAINELNKYVKEHDGATFDDFLFNAFISFELDPYADPSILKVDQMVEDSLKDEKIEIKKAFKTEILKYFYFNKHSFKNIKLDDLLTKARDSANGKKEIALYATDLLIIKPTMKFGEYLIKVMRYKQSDGKIALSFEFYAYKTITLRNLEEEEADKIIESIKSDDSSFAYSYLKRYFQNGAKYDNSDDFNKIETDKENSKKISDLVIAKQPRPTLERASKELDDNTDETSLNYGTHMHSLLEAISFTNPDYTFIENNREKELVKGVIKILSNFDIDKANIYKEYQFIDQVNGHKGIIDLLILHKDKAIIVDYKLKNISDKDYEKQLSIYKDFAESTFKVQTEAYLLSIIGQTIERVL